MNRPIGIISSSKQSLDYINALMKEDDEVLELDSSCNVEDIKEFRNFLMKIGMNRKVGIIHFFNKFSNANQAVLLKIFEELPEQNMCFFFASFLPNFTIQTRSVIHYLPSFNSDSFVNQLMQYILFQMKENTLTKEMINGFKIVLQTQSLFLDKVISENERDVIFKGLGL